jgi:hypothetical protein
MLVGLQLVGDAAAPLKLNVLAPCVEPKFVPSINTDAPGTATPGDTHVMEGAELCAPKLTETLSNVAVDRVAVPSLPATRPTYAFASMLIVCIVPTCVQFTPSGEA